MLLHFQRHGQGEPLVILHGLFGTLENWGAQIKELSEHFDVIAADLRNHGRSPHSDEMNYQAMSNDLLDLLDHLQLEHINLMGHSMGGKAAMQFALDHPERVKRLIVVDIAPVEYPPHHNDVIAGLNQIDLLNLKSRGDADRTLSEYIDSAATRAFLLKNLYRNEHKQFAWRMNLPVLEQQYARISESPEGSRYTGEVLFIKGGESNYLMAEHQQPIQQLFPHASFKIIAGAGHLPHVEKPTAFTRLVENFLAQ
ncbi:alpha/beta fold hydrolase [Marinobacterium sediminicola]|uniref:Esterase n=1 Tax=Marinobacterium sediminicola TaxID=518898 RepID=A0ABY1S065_9GAMM|nr:alpha/beta fold hydrolase [Marinobacterium sediminicola]ULG70008.1 alpha/beta fold hydrolase [Marinobacterium sediminicola]SMR74462.1 esterase [Marinobacterium sediminicola]